MWYRLTITNQSTNTRKYVFADNRWDLFAVIGWLYSFIDMSYRIYYDKMEHKDMREISSDDIITPNRDIFLNSF